MREEANGLGATGMSDVQQQITFVQPLDLAAIRLAGAMHRRIELAIGHLRAERYRILRGEGFGSAWGADQAGRWIGAMSLASRYANDAVPELAEVVRVLLAHQQPSGFFGTSLTPSTWWGAGRALCGLLERWEAAGDAVALAAAVRLGDFYLENLPVCAPGIAVHHGGHEEGLVALWQATGRKAYLDLARRLPDTVEADFGCPGQATPNHHTHSYLSILRGCVRLYAATRESRFLARVVAAWEHILTNQMWVTGGISEGSAYPYETRDETCSVADWFRLSLLLWQVTQERKYIEVAEHVLLNHLLFDQDHSGGFCTFRSVAPDPTGYVRDAVAWFCCSMSGLRALLEATRFVYTTGGDAISVNFFIPSQASATVGGRTVRIMQAGSYPAGKPTRIQMLAPPGFPLTLKVRVPQWAEAARVRLNGREVEPKGADGYVTICHEWAAEDVVELEATPRLALIQAGENGFGACTALDGATSVAAAALRYGPLVLMLDPGLNIYDGYEPERFAITVADANGSPSLPSAPTQASTARGLAVDGASLLTLCRPLGAGADEAPESLGFLVPVSEVTDRWSYTRSRLTPYEVRNEVRLVRGDEAVRFAGEVTRRYRDLLAVRAADTAALPDEIDFSPTAHGW